MDFHKLPTNSYKLLEDILESDNPVRMLCARFDAASNAEDEELRAMIRDLREKGLLNISWADDKPYRIVINNSARTYKERLAQYEKEHHIYDGNTSAPVNNYSITIGDGNHIKNSKIIAKENNYSNDKELQKTFAEKHPILISVIVSFIVGFVLLFSFWKDIIAWIEGWL